MLKRYLGHCGLEISVLGFGTMSFGAGGQWPGIGGTGLQAARRQVDLCLDAGITLFDSADAYSRGESEELLGDALTGKRNGVVIATKVFGRMGEADHDTGLSRRHVIAACEASLRRLRTEWIDLYQVHSWDALVPVEESLRALDDLVRAGKVRYLGCSNLPAWQLMKALAAADRLGLHRYVGQQIQYSLAVRDVEHEIIPAGVDQGVGALIWSPLGQGYLTGKFRQGPQESSRLARSGSLAGLDNPRTRATVDVLDEIASVHDGATPGQIAIAWLLRKPGVSAVILGARTDEQLRENIAAASIRLSDEEMDRLDTVSEIPLPYPLTHQRRSGLSRNPPFPATIPFGDLAAS